MILGESQQFASPEEALAHYGVKGMRKGHGKPKRIDRKNGRDPKRLAILYGRQAKKATETKMANHVNERLGPINTKYKKADFTDADWGDPSTWSVETKEYYAEVTGLAVKANQMAVKEVSGVEPTGTRHAELNKIGDRIVVRKGEIEHADDSDIVAVLKVVRDSKGLITMVEPFDQAERGVEFIDQLVQRRTV